MNDLQLPNPVMTWKLIRVWGEGGVKSQTRCGTWPGAIRTTCFPFPSVPPYCSSRRWLHPTTHSLSLCHFLFLLFFYSLPTLCMILTLNSLVLSCSIEKWKQHSTFKVYSLPSFEWLILNFPFNCFKIFPLILPSKTFISMLNLTWNLLYELPKLARLWLKC